MKLLDQCLGHVRPHGSYISDWATQQPNRRYRQVFRFLMRVSETVANAMVQEAIATNCDGYPEDEYGAERWCDEEGEINRPKAEEWMRLGNKDFIIINRQDYGEHVVLTALYNHDGKFQLYQGNLEDAQEYIRQRQPTINDAMRFILFGIERIPDPPKSEPLKVEPEVMDRAINDAKAEHVDGLNSWGRLVFLTTRNLWTALNRPSGRLGEIKMLAEQGLKEREIYPGNASEPVEAQQLKRCKTES